ncbi:MAG: hypothetical protein EBS65_04805 [Betaproteobacteria bacterium]|nr:hypothetical protein [Betaproteobacteria bacterium]
MERVAAGVAMAVAAGPSAMAAGRGLAGAFRRAIVATFLVAMETSLFFGCFKGCFKTPFSLMRDGIAAARGSPAPSIVRCLAAQDRFRL